MRYSAEVSAEIEGGVIRVTTKRLIEDVVYKHEVAVMNTFDAKVRIALIALGWEPPPTKACPWCGVQVDEADDTPRPSDYCHH